MSIRIGVAGAYGRMGRAIMDVINDTATATLSGAWDQPGSDLGLLHVGNTTVQPVDNLSAVACETDVVIDFTAPDATTRNAQLCAEHGTALVVGTTGLTADQQAVLDRCAQTIPLVQAPNMSIGVNVMLAIIADASRMLGPDYDLEIVEAHHKHKVDAPSGTALRLLDSLKTVRADSFGQHVRDGQIGPRHADEIGIQTLRGGDVVGEHTVFYFGEGERLEITHRATDRRIFARGAVRAALWAVQQTPGRYGMSDVLR